MLLRGRHSTVCFMVLLIMPTRCFEERVAVEPVPGEGEERELRIAKLLSQPRDLFVVLAEPSLEGFRS